MTLVKGEWGLRFVAIQPNLLQQLTLAKVKFFYAEQHSEKSFSALLVQKNVSVHNLNVGNGFNFNQAISWQSGYF